MSSLDYLSIDFKVAKCLYTMTDVEKLLHEQNGVREVPFANMDKTGKAACNKFDKGLCELGEFCPLRHLSGDKQVVCKHWLRGLCKKSDQCEFLHEYDLAKMPECFFFSKYGVCSNRECLFRHVDPESKIKDCPWYDRGFCRHGPYCKQRHRRRALCPNFICGFCPEGQECKFAHPSFKIPTSTDSAKNKQPVSSNILCHNCHERGHKASGCPNLPLHDSMKIELDELSATWAGPEEKPTARTFVSASEFKRRDLSEVTCYKCAEVGHYANRCPKGNLAFLSNPGDKMLGFEFEPTPAKRRRFY